MTLWSANWFWVTSLDAVCHVCVNCFVLISGYFLCTSAFRLEKWVSVWLTAAIYSVGIYLALAIVGIVPLGITELIKSAMVLTMEPYWFVTPYLLMYAISPLLNHAIRAMNQKQHLLCCAALLLCFSVLPNIVYINDFSRINGGFDVLWFCVLYLVAAYIRRYIPGESIRKKKTFALFLSCMIFFVAAICLAYLLTPMIFGRTMLTTLFYGYNSIPLAFGSIFLMLTFCGIQLHGNVLSKGITFAAPAAFSVYLISHHPVLKSCLWARLSPSSWGASPWLIVHMLVSVGGIFLTCCIIDHLRRWLFRICRIDWLTKKVCDGVTAKVDKLFTHLTTR